LYIYIFAYISQQKTIINLKPIKMNNLKVIEILAKSEVRFEAKFGRTITLEQARKKVKKKLAKLEKENDYPY
jgi:hypothetical protein